MQAGLHLRGGDGRWRLFGWDGHTGGEQKREAGSQEWKHSWVVRHDGLIFGSGWYQNLPVWTQGEPGE